jgi:hypothetical protein
MNVVYHQRFMSSFDRQVQRKKNTLKCIYLCKIKSGKPMRKIRINRHDLNKNILFLLKGQSVCGHVKFKNKHMNLSPPF